MKQLSNIIALYLFGLDALQIVIAAGVIILMLKIFMEKISGSRRRRITRRKTRDMESDMWSIE